MKKATEMSVAEFKQYLQKSKQEALTIRTYIGKNNGRNMKSVTYSSTAKRTMQRRRTK